MYNVHSYKKFYHLSEREHSLVYATTSVAPLIEKNIHTE